MRTFTAIEIPSDVQRALRSAQQRLQDRLAQHNLPPVMRWTNTDNLHLTLRFLGETDETRRRRFQAGLAEIAAAHEPFSLSLAGPGCFNSWSNLRALWVGVGGDTAALQAVQTDVESLARQVGFAAERKRFSPHITLARCARNAPRAALRTASDQLRRATAAEAPRSEIDWNVSELRFIRSILGRGGAQYFTLARCLLGAGAQRLY